MFHPDNLQNELWGSLHSNEPQYPRQFENEISLALSEAWAWLHAQGLVVPANDTNGQNDAYQAVLATVRAAWKIGSSNNRSQA